jgi:hypothetical protein
VKVVLSQRHVWILLLALLLQNSAWAAQKKQERALAPQVSFERVSRSEFSLDVTFPDPTSEEIVAGGRTWSDWKIAGLGSLTQTGAPALPVFTIWVPGQLNASGIEIVSKEEVTREGGTPIPAQEPQERSSATPNVVKPDPRIYASAQSYPASLTESATQGTVGSERLTLLQVHPLRYSGATGSYTFTKRLTLRLRVNLGSALDNMAARTRRERDLLEALPITPEESETPQEISAPRLWVVTDEQFVSELEPWLEWKRACGIPSEVIIFSQVAGSAVSLREYLRQRYMSSPVAPEYLLLVGDFDYVPGAYGVNSSLTDHHYSELSGDDFFPDVSVGRLPCNNVTQLSQWIERALAYERDGELSGANATVFSSSVALDPLHGAQVADLFESAPLTTAHLQQPQSGALPLLAQALQSDPLWTFYIGHGNTESWLSVAPHFTTDGLSLLENSRPSIVMSVACATADFDCPDGSIGERWLFDLMDNGALCYLGATESTAFFYSDTIGLGTMEALFSEGFETLGPALDYGKLRCAQSFPQIPGGLTEETIEQFVLFGDPSLRVFRAMPRNVSVEYPARLPTGSSAVVVTVLSNGSPLSGIDVVLSREDSPPVIVPTNSSGHAIVPLPEGGSAEYTVTCLGANIRPFQGSLTVTPMNGPLTQWIEAEFIETSGDGDGIPDRGEQGRVRVLVRNSGTGIQPAAILTLTSASPSLSVVEVPCLLQAMLPQSEDWLEIEPDVTISQTAEEGERAELHAWIHTDSAMVYAGTQELLIRAPRVDIGEPQLTELSGDGDGTAEAGEMLRLQIPVHNSGGDNLRNLIADCSPSHEYLHIQNTRFELSELAAGASDTVIFDFSCDDNTPRGYAFEYNWSLQGDNQPPIESWGRVRVGRVPVFLYVLDEMPQQVAGVEGALQTLGIEYEQSETLPGDLSRYQSVWVFCGVHPNSRSISSLAAQTISAYLEDGGACYWEGADVWSFDLQTPLHSYFGIQGLSDGTGDAGPISGVQGTATENATFEYLGENSFVDRIAPTGSAFTLLRNSRQNANYVVCIANSGATYRTVGTSVELGALADTQNPSTRVALFGAILEWLGVEVRHDLQGPAVTHIPLSNWPTDLRAIPIRSDVQDASGVASVVCEWRIGTGSWSDLSMYLDQGEFVCAIPAQSFGTQITYRLWATDGAAPVNTTITDEYSFIVERRYDRIRVGEIPGLFALRHNGTSESTSLLATGSGGTAVVMLAAEGNSSSYITDVVDCSGLSSPMLSFQSRLRTDQFGEAAVARVFGSTDGGKTFPHMVWRRGPASLPVLESETVTESGLAALAGQSNVVLKFTYYGNRYWQVSDIYFAEGVSEAPVENLVLRPGIPITLAWAQVPDATAYRILASESADDSAFQEIATTSETTFVDKNALKHAARFYQVQALRDTPRLASPRSSEPSRIDLSYSGRVLRPAR